MSSPSNLPQKAHARRLEIELPGPLDLRSSFERFRRWGDDLLERWDGTTYLWTAPIGGRSVGLAARVLGTVDAPAVEVSVEDVVSVDPELVHAEVVARLVPEAPAVDAFRRLITDGADPLVADLEVRHRGLRPVLQRDPMIAIVRSISAQQINLTWAASIRRRLADAVGTEHRVDGEWVMSLDPERLAAVDPATLRALQFTSRKAASIVACAAAVSAGGYALEDLAALEDEAVIGRLTALTGVGRWTAEWFLARTLGRPRVVAGDLGVRKAVAAAYLPDPANLRDGTGKRLPSEDEVRSATRNWGEAAGIAQQLLLQWLGDGLPGSRSSPGGADLADHRA